MNRKLSRILLSALGGPIPVYNTSIIGIGVAILNIVWVVFTIIAVISFVVSGILFLTAQGNAEKLKVARASVIWGVAGIVVAILAFSIINIIGGSL